jgi:uncharacterized protein YndB with AHSA1/START domain
VDIRTGGVWRFTMHGPDGRDYPNRVTFTEMVPGERIAYHHTDDNDQPQITSHQTLVTFAPHPRGTELTMRLVFRSAEERDRVAREYGAIEGGKQCAERLAEHVALSDPDAFTIRRTLNHPRELVYRAWTQREHLLKWWGPKGFEVSACELDLRPGGRMHYGLRSGQGQEMWGLWVFREVMPPSRLSWVSSFSNPRGGVERAFFSNEFPVEVLSEIDFVEEPGGRTTLVMRGVPINATPAERAFFKNMHASMQGGWGGTLEMLESYLAGVKR